MGLEYLTNSGQTVRNGLEYVRNREPTAGKGLFSNSILRDQTAGKGLQCLTDMSKPLDKD